MSRFSRLVLLCMILQLPAVCFAARWYQDFETAVELIDAGDCSREAIQLLGAAVVDKPRPRLNARTIAVKTIDYLPYYQLARAHLACGELDSARHYIEVSREHGVAPEKLLAAVEQRLSQLAEQDVREAEPEVDPEALAALVRDATEEIRRAQSLEAQLDVRRGEARFAAVFQRRTSSLQQAASDLATAQELLNEGTLRRDKTTIQNAAAAASRALSTFSDVQGEIAAILQATPTATPTRPPTRIPTRVPAVSRPTPRPTLPTTRAPVVPRQVPEALRRAAADYLRADYENMVNGLDPGGFRNDRERAAAHLLRAAGHFALYCIGGRTDDERLRRAHQDLDRCRSLAPSVEPDTRFFSPEFVNLYRGRR